MRESLEKLKFKITNLFFSKEKQGLLKKYKKKKILDLLKLSSMGLLLGSMLGVLFYMTIILFVLICYLFGYSVMSWFDVFNSIEIFMIPLGIATLLTIPLLRTEFVNIFKMVKNNDVEGFNKHVFDLEDSEAVDEMDDIVVDNETLIMVKKEILKNISEKDLEDLLKNKDFISLSKDGKITYKYFYRMIREIEKKMKAEDHIKETAKNFNFQRNIFFKKGKEVEVKKENIENVTMS
jgi:hypothetical protein